MSEINVEQAELSLNERNSITGSSGLHNLTGPRARFQPVRIKALLDLLESDDDDTEPRDSDNDSDTGSLPALPDDDDNDTQISPNPDEQALFAVKSDTKVLEDRIGMLLDNLTTNERTRDHSNEENYKQRRSEVKFEEPVENICRVSGNSNSLDSRNNTLSSNQLKVSQNLSSKLVSDNTDIRINFNPHQPVSPIKRVLNSYGTLETDTGTENNCEIQQERLDLTSKNDSDNQRTVNPIQAYSTNWEKSKVSGQQDVNYSAPETPLKHKSATPVHNNVSLSRRNIMETPRNKSHSEYSHSNIETPGIIFSHWSRNNFFQTPNQNSVLVNKNAAQVNNPMHDIKLQPHRFCSSEKKVVRRPLCEAIHLNHGSGANDNSTNHVGQHETIGPRVCYVPNTSESLYDVQRNFLTKENYPVNTKCNSKGNIADKIVLSLQEKNEQQHNNIDHHSKIISSVIDEKLNSHKNLEKGNGLVSNPPLSLPSISENQRDCDSNLIKKDSLNPKVNFCEFIVQRDGCEQKQGLQQKSDGQVNLQNNNIKSRNDAAPTHTKFEVFDGPPPRPMHIGTTNSSVSNGNNFESNPRSIQCSVASKKLDKKYDKIITVKGVEYQVLGKLGQGMSGEVLRVQDLKSGDLRAIKCVDLSSIAKETAEGCLEEVSMLDKLRAPCIINMINCEIRSNMLYVVMEMGDTDLSKLLKSMSQEKQLPLTLILYYWTEMLTAVKYIHDNGVIHSDLKPANFLLVRGRLKLIDFGIASTMNAEMTSVVKNTSLGTLNYMSPEAIIDIGGTGDSPNNDNKYKINYKTDVWSLGCILYSMVYGRTPFQHIRADWAKVSAITNPNQKIAFPPEGISGRGHTSPPPFLVEVMRRCLQHDRKARPSVSQLLQIPYVGCNCPPVSTLPNIPASILSKIKQSLEESEWRELLQALERRNPRQ